MFINAVKVKKVLLRQLNLRLDLLLFVQKHQRVNLANFNGNLNSFMVNKARKLFPVAALKDNWEDR